MAFHNDHLADLRKSGLSDTITMMGIDSVCPSDITRKLGLGS